MTSNNNNVGIYALADLSVSASDASSNAWFGIYCGGRLTMTSSKASNNGYTGVALVNGVVTGSSLVGNGQSGVDSRGGIGLLGGNGTTATITNNVITGNAVFGIFALNFSGTPVVG